ncbi:MAG: DUF1801 domain-containing protein [Gemmatimonadota bacterium]|nr:DUF1801 domain-containing protein [Gemmatimonadota bacterium]
MASTQVSPAKQITVFLDKYTPEIVAAAAESRTRLRKQIPGGIEFVYDNYNALVFGYGPSERPSEAVLSLAIMPQWVTLCFLKGAKLSDPKGLLRGTGNIVRNIRLREPEHLEERDVRDLIRQAVAAATPSFPTGGGRQTTVIKSISAKQRPRRPSSNQKR